MANNIPMCLELTRSLRALEYSFNCPDHVAVHCGGRRPSGVEQRAHLSTQTFNGDARGSNAIMSMMIA